MLAGRPVAGAGGQPEGEPGVGWGEDPRRLGEVPPTPPACPAGVARAALRDPGAPRMLVTRTLEGDGYRIENLVFESRPGLVVTANLYRPAIRHGRCPAS